MTEELTKAAERILSAYEKAVKGLTVEEVAALDEWMVHFARSMRAIDGGGKEGGDGCQQA